MLELQIFQFGVFERETEKRKNEHGRRCDGFQVLLKVSNFEDSESTMTTMMMLMILISLVMNTRADTRMTIHEYWMQEYNDCGYGTSSCTCTL